MSSAWRPFDFAATSIRAVRDEFTEQRKQLNYAGFKVKSDDPVRSV